MQYGGNLTQVGGGNLTALMLGATCSRYPSPFFCSGIVNNYLASLASISEYPFLIKNVALT